MEIIIIINILASLGVIVYILHKSSKDKIETVREVTKALMAKNLTEYSESVPEEGEEEMEEIPDELEDVYEADEKMLIKHLKQEHADIEN